METIRSLAHDYENVWGSMVKQTMSRLNPGFSPSKYGYASFNGLLKDAEQQGHISVDLDKARGNHLITIKDA